MDWFISGFQIPSIVQRKQVKEINIRVTWDGKVVVSVPMGASDELIEKVLKRKADWISKKLEEMETRRKQLPLPYQFVDGETFWVLGKPVTLKVMNGREDKVGLRGRKLEVRVTASSAGKVRQAIVRWLQEQALKVVSEKVEKFAEVLEVKPEGVELREWKGKWGLCNTSKGVLRFNWRLIQLPESLIDYIAVHELAHLRHPKHDSNFWALVSRIVPDWKSRHRELEKWAGALMW